MLTHLLTHPSDLLMHLPAAIVGGDHDFAAVPDSAHTTARGATRVYQGTDGVKYRVTVEPILRVEVAA